MTGKEIAAVMIFALEPGQHFTFIDLLAKFHINYVLMGEGTVNNEEKVLYRAIGDAKALGLLRKSEVLRGYERI